MDTNLCTCNVRNLYRAVARELARYKLDLASVKEARWGNVGTVRTEDYTFFCAKVIEKYQ
jgi:hypothetical protein